MPFTLAHPVAVLPLRRLLGDYVSVSALVVGSMTPDLAYFFNLGVAHNYSHSLAAVAWFSVPCGLLAWTIWQVLLWPFVFALLPEQVARRMREPAGVRWSAKNLGVVCGSVALGAVTHLIWDSFTHGTGVAVQVLPALQTRVVLTRWFAPRAFTLLQDASSLAGMALLVFMAARWYARTPIGANPRRLTLPVSVRVAIVVILIALPLAVSAPRKVPRHRTFNVFQGLVTRTVISAGSTFLVSLVVCASAWRLVTPAKPEDQSQPENQSRNPKTSPGVALALLADRAGLAGARRYVPSTRIEPFLVDNRRG